MPGSLFIELEPDAIAMVRALMPLFGSSDIAATVAQALGVAKVTGRYVKDGVLTVVDPRSGEPDLAATLVDIDVRYEPSGDASSRAA
jgi:hypothetical protein